MSTTIAVRRAAVLSLILLSRLAGDPAAASGGDWPQILGPQRNGRAADQAAVSPWKSGTLNAAWSYAVGEGYAGPAVAAQRVLIWHRVGDSERAEALETATGVRIWKTDFPASYQGGVDPDKGPRCVPLIHGDRVLLFGAVGDLHCVGLDTGRVQWSRQVYGDFRGNEGYFGAGSSPLVVGDRVLVNAGGTDQAGIVAFALRDGTTLWKATDERASYSSPVCVPVGERTAVALVTRLNFLVLRPEDGRVLFRTPFGQRGPTVNAASPLVFDQHVFLTANYGVGGQLLRLTDRALEVVWANDESLSSQYPTPVYFQGHLYGIHGREDVGVASLRCVAAKTGQVQWSQDGFGMAHLILVGDQLLVMTVDGRLLLAKASPDKFQLLAEAKLSTATTRALPALADGRLFIRETRDQAGTVQCFPLPAP